MAQGLTAAPSVAALRAIAPDIRVVPARSTLFRVYFRGGRFPASWDAFRPYGPTGSRFDHQPPPPGLHPTRSIFYASSLGPTALAEVFQATRTIDRSTDSPALVAFDFDRDLALLDLTGLWPTQVGGSMAIHSGSHARSRQWSRAIYDAYPNVEGVFYASSMYALQPALALYERAQSALPPAPRLDLLLTDPGLVAPLAAAARELHYALI